MIAANFRGDREKEERGEKEERKRRKRKRATLKEGIMSGTAQRIGGVVYGLRNMMAWLWGVAYDRMAICGRVTREAKDLPTGQCC